MPIPFFTATKNLTGGCLFVNPKVDPENGSAFYLSVSPQVGFDEGKGRGGSGRYDYANSINVKVSVDEAAGLVRAVRTDGEWSFYHDFGNAPVRGNFRYFVIEPKSDKERRKEGFGLTVDKGGKEIKIGFSLGSAEKLAQIVEWGLHRIFSAEHDHSERKRKEKAKNGNAKAAQEQTQSPPDETPGEPAPKEENAEDWGGL